MALTRRSLLLALILASLVSCRHRKTTPEIGPIVSPADTTQPIADVTENDVTFKGLFVVGNKSLSFRECNDPDHDLAVIDSTHKMKDLYKSIFLHSPAFPNEYVYVEVKGHVQAATPDEMKLGYDSAILVDDVLTFEQKNYQNSCIPYDFWCMGKGWSLQISAREKILVLKDLDLMKSYVFEYFPPRSQGDEVFTYASNNYAAGMAIKAVLRKTPCEEDASSSSFQYSASVIVNGKVYKGCAIQGVL